MKTSRTAMVVVVLLLCSTGAGESQQSRGPLGLREQSPVYQLFHVPFMESADLADEGEWRGGVALAYSNIFEQGISPTHEIHFDMERLATTLRVAYGVANRLELGFRLTLQTTGGGVLDPLIEGVHEAFNLSNGSREEYPSGVHDVFLEERAGRRLFELGPTSLALEDLQVSGHYQLAGGAGDRHSLAAALTLTLPTATAGRGTGRSGGALTLLGRRSWDRWHAHALIGGTRLSPPGSLEALTGDWGAYWGLAVERALGESISGILQAMGTSRYLGGIGAPELDLRPLLWGFGILGGDRWEWQVAVVEDIPPNSPSADFTIHLQLSTAWE